MKLNSRLLFTLSSITLIIFLSAVIYIKLPVNPSNYIITHNFECTDCIVFLAQKVKTERIDYAFELANICKPTSCLFSPGGEKGLRQKYIDQLLCKEKNKNSQFYKSDNVAFSTISEAANTKEFINKKGYSSITIVTSFYHSYRAYFVFKSILPKNTKILSCPVPAQKSTYKQLYKNNKRIKNKFKKEKFKLLYSRIVCRLGILGIHINSMLEKIPNEN